MRDPRCGPRGAEGAQRGKQTRLGWKELGVAFPGPLPPPGVPGGGRLGGVGGAPSPLGACSAGLQSKPLLSNADFPFNTF